MRIFVMSIASLAFAPILASCSTAGQNPPGPIAQNNDAAKADMAFGQFSARYIEEMSQLNPVAATQLGNHAYDSHLPDISEAGRAHQTASETAFLNGLKAIDYDRLSRDNQVDYKMLQNALQYSLWQSEVEQQWAWNPQYYNDTVSYALYGLMARDFAPWPQRFDNIVSRMEKIPAFLAAARQQIDVGRVPKIHAQTVARQNTGILEIIDAALLPEVESASIERSRFDVALGNLKTAIAQHQKWIDEVLIPGAKGDFRLGAERYDAKMKFALMSPIGRPELRQRALASKTRVREEMYDISRVILADNPNAPEMPAKPDAPQQQAVIQAALALSYANRAPRGQLEQKARETLAQVTRFTREKGFVRMPDGPVQVITMPKFWQGNAVAYDDAPGPLERDLPNYYAVSPIPADWSEQQAASFLSEYNVYMLHDLSIHEGVPGHYLQLDHANKDGSVLRAVLGSGPFVEGWAVYAEGLMADQGYLGGMTAREGQLFRLTMLKMRLRSITNTLLDIGIHTQGMTRPEAMELMMQGAFQKESEAAGKWIRANLTSVQLLSYFTGYEEHRALRAEAERRWGDEFDLRAYHDKVLSHGSPPAKYARALLFGLPVQ